MNHPQRPDPDDDEELRRLRWHCRRGMLELDHLLLTFLDRGYRALAGDDRARFVRLLECQDQDLSDWLMRRRAGDDPELQRIVDHVVDIAGELPATAGPPRSD